MSTMQTWFITQYCKMKGTKFLQSLITPIFSIISVSPFSFDVDLDKVNPFFVATNKILFQQVLQLFVDKLLENIESLPKYLFFIFISIILFFD